MKDASTLRNKNDLASKFFATYLNLVQFPFQIMIKRRKCNDNTTQDSEDEEDGVWSESSESVILCTTI